MSCKTCNQCNDCQELKPYCNCIVKDVDVEIEGTLPLIVATDVHDALVQILLLIHEGVPVLDETLTTISIAGQFITYTDELGNPTVLDLGTSFAETLTTLTSTGSDLLYTDEAGIVTTIPIVDVLTSVSRVGDDLIYVDEIGGSTTIPLATAGVLTSMTLTGTVLSYIAEDGNTTAVNLNSIETLTTLTIVGQDIIYTDEAGTINTIPIPSGLETLTTLSIVGTDLRYVDEVAGITNIPLNTINVLTTLTKVGDNLQYIDELGVATNIDISAVTNILTVLTRVGDNLQYVDELGATATIPLTGIANVLTTLAVVGNNLNYVDENGATTTIALTTLNILTAMVKIGDDLIYTDEYGNPTTVDLSNITNILTTLSYSGGSLHYVDELGNMTSIPIGGGGGGPETLTVLSKSGDDLLYVDELGATTTIDISNITNILTVLSLVGNDLLYVDELGATTTLDLSALETLTTLAKVGDNLQYVDEAGVMTVLNMTDVLTTLGLVGTDLIYVDEVGVTTTIDLSVLGGGGPDVLTTLTRTGNDLIYVDELGATTTIDITDVLTTLTLTGSDLNYTDELGNITVIDLTTAETLTTVSRVADNLLYVDEDGITTTIPLGTGGGGGGITVENITLAALKLLIGADALYLNKIYRVTSVTNGTLDISEMLFRPTTVSTLQTDVDATFVGGRYGTVRYDFPSDNFYQYTDNLGVIVSATPTIPGEQQTLYNFPYTHAKNTVVTSCEYTETFTNGGSTWNFTNVTMVGSTVHFSDQISGGGSTASTFQVSDTNFHHSYLKFERGSVQILGCDIRESEWEHNADVIIYFVRTTLLSAEFYHKGLVDGNSIIISDSHVVASTFRTPHTAMTLSQSYVINVSDYSNIGNPAGANTIFYEIVRSRVNGLYVTGSYTDGFNKIFRIIASDVDGVHYEITSGGLIDIQESRLQAVHIETGGTLDPKDLVFDQCNISATRLHLAADDTRIRYTTIVGKESINYHLRVNGTITTSAVIEHVNLTNDSMLIINTPSTITARRITISNGGILETNGGSPNLDKVTIVASNIQSQNSDMIDCDFGGIFSINTNTFNCSSMFVRGLAGVITLTGVNAGTYAMYTHVNTLV